MQKRITLYLVLSLGLLAVSFGSIFARLSQEAPSLTIALYRMFWAALFTTPFFWFRGSTKGGHVSWKLRLLSGLALGLHFAFWIASLRLTSVAVSVLLVNMSPAIVAFLSYLIFGERLSLKKIMGLCLATLGSSVLFWHDFTSLGNWKGAAFALLGALMFAVYLLSGRKIRQERSTLEYIYPTYAIAAAVLFLLTLIADVPLIGFSGKTYLFLLLLGLIPQCLGHTSCNWALKYLSATVVSTLVLTEPILATLLAWLILGEGVGPIVLLGACLVGSGILIVSQGEISKKESSGAEIKEARNRTRRN